MSQSCEEQLKSKLIQLHGKIKGQKLAKKYSPCFSKDYFEICCIETACDDINHLEKLSENAPLSINFYDGLKKEELLHLRLYQWQKPIALSDILPILENFDLFAVSDAPQVIPLKNNNVAWINDFTLKHKKTKLNTLKVKGLFQNAFCNVYTKKIENDGFNKLVLNAEIPWQEVTIFRVYAKYLHQVHFRFSERNIVDALANNVAIAKNLILLFNARFGLEQRSKHNTHKIEKTILEQLDAIVSLVDDKILRQLLILIKATLRTNYFQKNADGSAKEFLSIKLSSRTIPELPLPAPLYEIFVYSPRFEAIHLRNTKIARGGLRWSDRPEDFRTEILGLLKAQVVKNSVIIPSGAKGGFILKAVPENASWEIKQAEGIYCYKSFITALLDLTDNIINGKPIPPKDVVCLDDADPYLVVAADKGTAKFSDIANAISLEKKFWLGDAFASGGATGYDHKKIGITARGAWESIKRHFRELEMNIASTNFTVIGIGDMSGDVFGNGMLYSKHIKLVAAFDHRNIFLDPNPNPAISYLERRRLFNLPTSSWEDYNPKLISKGGGVFKCSLKSITLSPEMQEVLAIDEKVLTPANLIGAILKAPVDLFFNGGIGTFVKASFESNADAADRSNDYCRINANELRCKVVGEGGNLGFTQRARIEYAANGGLINTDSIDNSGGVDCSDHEVNLKILIDAEVYKKKISQKMRNKTLASLTEEVASLVLKDNYNQALVLSFTNYTAKSATWQYINYIKDLGDKGLLDWQVEFLPDEKTLLERIAAKQQLYRPELAVLLAYTKINLKHEILLSNLPEETYLAKIIEKTFPNSISKKFKASLENHYLKREIIATFLSNEIINEVGISFIYNLQIETGADVEEIFRTYTIVSNIFETHKIQEVIMSLDFKISKSEQYDMLTNVRTLITSATHWFLKSKYINQDLTKTIEHFSPKIKLLLDVIPNLMSGMTKDYLKSLTDKFVAIGLSEEMSRKIAVSRAIYAALNIIEVATSHKFDLVKTAKIYFLCGTRLNLVELRDHLAKDTTIGHLSMLARFSIRHELDVAQRALTIFILQHDRNEKNTEKLFEDWATANQRIIQRWNMILNLLRSSGAVDYSMLFIASKELLSLIG